jgi:hypothetical protein
MRRNLIFTNLFPLLHSVLCGIIALFVNGGAFLVT